MSDAVAVRSIIQQEGLNASVSASSSTVQEIGRNINFQSQFNSNRMLFTVSGNYGKNVADVPHIKIDSSYPVLVKTKVVGFGFLNETAGDSGTLEIDIVRITSAGVQSSIFSTKPQIPFGAGDFARMAGRIYPTVSTLVQTATTVLPVFSITELNPGDFIYMNLTSKQSNGEDFDFVLETIPIS